MFIHFSIFMIISKEKGQSFEQKEYDSFFHSIENNLRELGFGDVSVNKKMKDFNKILYDILLKLKKKDEQKFSINKELILNYFSQLGLENKDKYQFFEQYFIEFHKFCSELNLNNMVRDALKFKNYGCS